MTPTVVSCSQLAGFGAHRGLDRAGKRLLEGGGTLVLAGDDRFHGPGCNALFAHAGKTYHVYHAYDGNANGRATLRIAEIAWDEEGWPVSLGP